MTKSNLTSIQAYRRKPHFNIGIVIFGVILIYLVVTVLTYLTDKHISVYEVRDGSILKDRAYTGLAIRNETVFSAESEGYINYFTPEGSKVGARTDVYTLSEKKLNFKDSNSEEQTEFSADEQSALFLKIQSFTENSDEMQFHDVYTLKSNLEAAMESKSSQSRQIQLKEMLEKNSDSLKVFKAASDGIILYSTDGFESVKPEDVTERMLSKDDYQVRTTANNTTVRSGTPIYKLITEDRWTLAILLSDAAAQEMAETKRVKVKFSKDNQIERADFSVYNTPDYHLGLLTFDNAMIRYAKERYLDIELILDDKTGLKIPKSSVVKKAFYTVPEDYLTQGGNSNETGVLIENGTDHAKFKKVDVYFRDNDKGMVYLNPLDFDDRETVLLKPESADRFPLKETKNLKGVYNINKGYAVFKQIQILCESEEYYIVETGSDYSLTNYDHIALDGAYVKENDVVF